MQFLLLAISDEAAFNHMPKDEQKLAFAAFGEYGRALREAGVYVGSYRPQPMATSRTVSVRGGTAVVRDGPYIETTEPITGVYVVDVPDIAAALSWAERNPAASFGVVEVRPL